MTFLKPLHLFEVYLYENTKRNAFNIINSEPTSSIRKKVYADRYEISAGGLTFFQSAKNASDELVEVPVISYPQGKWISVSLIRNRMIIAEHKTGASTGASHLSIQPELKKNKGATTNTFKIIQMPAQGQETQKEFNEINRLMEQVNKLVDSQKDILLKLQSNSTPVSSEKLGKTERLFEESSSEQIVNNEPHLSEDLKEKTKDKTPKKITTPTEDTPQLVNPPEIVKENYAPEDIASASDIENEVADLWADMNNPSFSENPTTAVEIEDEQENTSNEPVVHEVSDDFGLNDFNIDIDEITSSLSDNNTAIGQEAEMVVEEEIIQPKPTDVGKKVKSEQVAPPKPPTLPVTIPDMDSADDIMGLLDSLSDSPSVMSEAEIKEFKIKKKAFIVEHLTTHIESVDVFNFDNFIKILISRDINGTYKIQAHDVEWEISQALINKKISPRRFIKEKLQKHISLLLPGIMRKSWDGNIIPILDIAKTHNEAKEMTLIDLAVWMSQNGYK